MVCATGVLTHEGVGKVVGLGERVEDLREGDRVKAVLSMPPGDRS